MITLLLLISCIIASVIFGVTDISLKTVIKAYTDFTGSNKEIIIKTTRVPRALIATFVGGSLAIAGALMQALTKNPLASPGIFGVNAGASFFVVLGISFLSVSSLGQLSILAFLGAAISAGIVYALGSVGRDGLTPLKLTLAGAAITALFSSFTQGMLVLNEKALDSVLFWLTGSVAGRDLNLLLSVLPYILVGWIAAFVIAKAINILVMGEDIAKGLGQKTALVKLMAGVIIVLLAGSSVAVAGPIGFIGIIIPHLARFLVGRDYRWLLPYSALLGAILLLLADIGARYIIMPQEVPVGVMTAFIGTPFFIYIARRRIGN
ncbi:FecCD family ABC transporter permease [Halanaerocella petrolearia]